MQLFKHFTHSERLADTSSVHEGCVEGIHKLEEKFGVFLVQVLMARTANVKGNVFYSSICMPISTTRSLGS